MLFSTASMFLQRSTIIIYGYSELLWNYMRYGRCRNMDVVEYSTCTLATALSVPAEDASQPHTSSDHGNQYIQNRSCRNPTGTTYYNSTVCIVHSLILHSKWLPVHHLHSSIVSFSSSASFKLPVGSYVFEYVISAFSDDFMTSAIRRFNFDCRRSPGRNSTSSTNLDLVHVLVP